MASVNKFWKIIGVKLDLTPKREFVLLDLLYKCTNLQKLWRSASICFKGPNRASQLSFQEDFSKFSLTPSPIFDIEG
jgi:hypothetical protein